MTDVIGIFGFKFIIIILENSESSDSKNLKNLKSSEDFKNSLDFTKFKEFMTNLFQWIYIYDYVDFFFSSINTVITIRIDSNDWFFNMKKNWLFFDLIEK